MICFLSGALFAAAVCFCLFHFKSYSFPLRFFCDLLLTLTGALPFVLYVAVYKNGLYGAQNVLPFLTGAAVVGVLFLVARKKRGK